MTASFEPCADNHAVNVCGDPRKPPILLLHGLRLGAAIWSDHAAHLSREFYLVAPDLPGHGALADQRFDPQSCDALIRTIVARYCAQPPVIVGYSMGGYVAMRYTRDHAGDSAALVLAGCSFDFSGAWGATYRIVGNVASRLPRHFVDGFIAGYFRVRLPNIADRIVPLAFDQQVFRTSAEFSIDELYSQSLRAYEKSVLIVNGGWDALFRSQERRFARAMQARIAIISGSDHAAPLRRPAEFSEIVRAFALEVFLQSHPSTGSG